MPTTPDILIELQTGVANRLIADATLMSMITGVLDLDAVNETQALPYLSFGQHVDQPWQTFGHTNSDAFFLLDIWSTTRENAYAILAEVKRLLDNKVVTMAHYGHSRMAYDWSTAMYDETAGDWHMPVRFVSLAVEI